MFKINQINEFISIALLDLDEFAHDFNINTKREIEQKGSLFLLDKLLSSKNFELCYSDNKKPFIKNADFHISISHSHKWLAVIKDSRDNTGIDLELIREKIFNIKHKFLNDAEEKYCVNNLVLITFVWSIKETLYKIFGERGIDFKRDMNVEPFDIKQSKTNGSIIINSKKHTYQIALEKFDNYCLTYVLNEI